MDTLNLPTRKNLLLAKNRLALAQKGYDLLDKKRKVLVNELAAVKTQTDETYKVTQEAIHKAHRALNIAHTEMGRGRIMDICSRTPKNTPVKITFRSIMGVDLPTVNIENAFSTIFYELHETTVSLDEAVLAWKEALRHIIAWAAVENTVHRLKLHIKKTQKRANALGNITIPMYEARIKYIQERLEERERDELARLKLAKKLREV